MEFDGLASSKCYVGVLFSLALLGRPIDFVPENALRPELRPAS